MDPEREAALRLADEIEASWYAHPRPSPKKPYTDRIRLFVAVPEGAHLLTMNEARGRIHYRDWAKLTKAWREAAAQVATERHAATLGLELPVGIDARPIQARGKLADAGAHLPALKACVDGLVDAGVVPDDGPDQVAYVRLWAPVKDLWPGLEITLSRPEAGEASR